MKEFWTGLTGFGRILGIDGRDAYESNPENPVNPVEEAIIVK
jgi:hypothetical protein